MARTQFLALTVALALFFGIALLERAEASDHPLGFARPLLRKRQPNNTTAGNQTNVTTIGSILRNNSNYTIYNELVGRTTYFNFLNETAGNYTVFAPIDEAFRALPAPMLNALNSSFGGPLVVGLLSYSIINGTVLNSTTIRSGTSEYDSLLGLPINVTKAGGTIAITGSSASDILAVVVDPDHHASNGVLHGINAVLDPLRAISSSTSSSTATSTGTVIVGPTITEGPSSTTSGSIIGTITEAPASSASPTATSAGGVATVV